MTGLQRQIEFYKEHQDEFAQNHHGEFVLLHGEKVVGFFREAAAAYAWAKEQFEPESFLIRSCIYAHEERPRVFRSRVA